jgi:hypothetical protein
MTFDVINRVPYLKTSRIYPQDTDKLVTEINISYVDTANAVNDRTIGLFPINRPAIGGEKWYIEGNKPLQNLRQVYPFTAAGNILHGINTDSVYAFTKCSGSYTDGTDYYGVIFSNSVAVPDQVSFYVTPTNIVVTVDGTAPVPTDGLIVLEWLSNP